MVNQREKQVLEQYQQDGWSVLHSGAPDFLCIKVVDGKIVDFLFREVKPPNGNLTYEQSIWKMVLEKLGANYQIVGVE